jgi:hypothetical protein
MRRVEKALKRLEKNEGNIFKQTLRIMENRTTYRPARTGRRVFAWIMGILIGALLVFGYFRFFFVFAEGVKSGQLKDFMHKGYVFKTYEGKLIQVGYTSAQGGGVQSNEFEFSVIDPVVAKELEANSGRVLDLRYRQYFGRLPWRGMQNYIVVGVENIQEAPVTQPLPIDIPVE